MTADQTIAVIAELLDAAPAPGETFNYAGASTFALSYALQQYVQEREGSNVNYWDLVEQNVLRVIGIDHFITQFSLESDGTAGVPTLAVGAYPTVDEAAKIALLFANNGQ